MRLYNSKAIIQAPFKCSKKFGSVKLAAIEDKGYNTSTI